MDYSKFKICKVLILFLINFIGFEVNCQIKSVVIIIADDFGVGDLNKYETPFLDSLSKNSLFFTRFVTNPRCTPSRMSFLNGYSSARLGINYAYNCSYGLRGGNLLKTDTTLAEVFLKSGFKTGIIGKWHLGENKSDHPNQHGFEYFYGSLSGMFDYITHVDLCGNRDLQENGNLIKIDKYYTYLITNKAIDFINKNKDNRFFLQINYSAPHAYEQYDDEILKQDDGSNILNLDKYIFPDSLRHAFVLNSMDSTIEKIFNEVPDNTLFIFFGDNGGNLKYAPSSNGSLKGGKGESFNGGINTPLIVASKSENLKGKVEVLYSILDLTKTIVKYFSLKAPDSFEGHINTFQPNHPTPDFYIKNQGGHFRNHDKAAFIGNWKWVMRNGKDYLYNWTIDWNEKNNLSLKHKNTLKKIKARWEKWDSKNISIN